MPERLIGNFKHVFFSLLFCVSIVILSFIVAGVSFAQISCSGLASTQRSSNDIYKVTAFGCVDGWSDPGDNCQPAHGNPPEYCSASMSGPDCEREIEWFAANTDVFGKWKKLLVTREDTGKSVVVLTIDIGPHCERERLYGPLLDLSYSAATYLGPNGGNYETVKAVPVADDTPLGPTDGSNVETESGSETDTGGGGSRSDQSCWITAVGNPNEDDKPFCDPGGGSFGVCGEAPAPPGDVKQAIIDKWGITLNLPQNQLELAWQEFHEIDCTGFLQAIRGSVVGSWDSGYAQQFSCPQDGDVDVMFSSQWGGTFMKAILVHELAHVWQFCSSQGEQNRLENNRAYDEEGGLTNYSRTGCGFDVSLYNENHADSVALYLNPEEPELTCGNGAPNPFSNGGFPVTKSTTAKGVPVLRTKGVGPTEL